MGPAGPQGTPSNTQPCKSRPHLALLGTQADSNHLLRALLFPQPHRLLRQMCHTMQAGCVTSKPDVSLHGNGTTHEGVMLWSRMVGMGVLPPQLSRRTGSCSSSPTSAPLRSAHALYQVGVCHSVAEAQHY